MSFYYPLGLLGLIGIPILIIIYIIKSKYTEQTIASTYLWTLSERFLKKRKPISKLTGIITLIVQILAVIFASLLVAHPLFTIKNSANEILFVLDGSASMNMSDGSTRFERAQQSIYKIVDKSRGGSSYSLVFVRDGANVVFEGVTDKDQVKSDVSALSAGWGDADCSAAVNIAQDYFDLNRSTVVYLVTDKQYEVENINLVNVSRGETNLAFTRCDYKYESDGVRGFGEIVSYGADASVSVELWARENNGDEIERFSAATVRLKADEPKEFEIKSALGSFSNLEMRIAASDALGQDNTVVLYDEAKSQDRRVLIVSDLQDSAYLKNAISGAGKAVVEMMSTAKYEESAVSGYGLYVFNGYTPSALPKNSAIWLVDAVDGNGSGSKIAFRDYESPRDTTGSGSYFIADYAEEKSLNAQGKGLLKDLLKRDVVIRRFAKYGVPRSFTAVMSVNDYPVIAAGLNGNNDREVVFAFRIGDSNFGLSPDFLILVRNLINYSFPSVVDETSYSAGEIMSVNVVPGTENIVVTSPSGKSITLDTLDSAICEVKLDETGVYRINVKKTGTEESEVYAFAGVPASESNPSGDGTFVLNGEREYNYSDGFYDNLLAFFIVIAVLLAADWGLYCYEQYQLR